MSLLLFSAVGLTGMVVGRAVARYYAKRKAETTGASNAEEEKDESSDARAPKAAAKKKRDVAATTPASPSTQNVSGFACQLSDVVMLGTGEEAWLCGAVSFSEEKGGKGAQLAVLFSGPNMSGERFVLARKHAGAEDLFWLRKVDALPPYPGAEPPHVIELDGVRFDRERRLPVYTVRLGVDAPSFDEEVVLAEYHASTEERLFVVTASSRCHAYRGERLMQGMYDVLPGADR